MIAKLPAVEKTDCNSQVFIKAIENAVIHFRNRGAMTDTVHIVIMLLNTELADDTVCRNKLVNWLEKYTGKNYGKDTEPWQQWFYVNKNYLYWENDKKLIMIDEGAKAAGIPTDEYRKSHPWPNEKEPDKTDGE